jgi:hypothetical protein
MRVTDIDHAEGMLLESRVGREFQHLEDLVFVDGSAGAQQAVAYLLKLFNGQTRPLLKWDGSPTIYFGRLPGGEFVLVGKNAWQKRQLLTSPEQVYEFATSTGRGEDWRSEFGQTLVDLWHLFEPATPPGFRGFCYADVLFHPGAQKRRDGDTYAFTPNKVTYRVRIDSDFGPAITVAQAGVAVHAYASEYGSTNKVPIGDTVITGFGSDVMVFGVLPVQANLQVPNELGDISQAIDSAGDDIDQFLMPAPRLSNPAGAIYKFTNQTLPDGYDNLLEKFESWILSNLSANQSGIFREKIQSNPRGARALFGLVSAIGHVKNHAIEQFDNNMSDITAQTGSEWGGEGYVDAQYKVKLVKRTRWNPRG